MDCLDSVKNLRFFLDSNLTIEHQIKHAVKKCFFHIRNIGKIRKFLTIEFCKVLVNSLVISQLDYCYSVYYGLPSYQFLRLQRVQNTAARLISCSHKYDHITPALIELCWLPIKYRLKFKILLHVFKVVNDLSPTYLTDLITHQSVSSRSLRSTDSNLLFVPRTFSAFGDRCFSVCGPRLWNALPPHKRR